MKNWELAFTGTWPTLLVLGLGAVAAALAYLFYLKKRGNVPPRIFKTLSILRALAIITVALFLLKPVIRYTRTKTEDTVALVMLDVSKSMSIEDAAGERSRLEAAHRLLNRDPANLLERLEETQTVRLFAFGSYTAEKATDAELEANQSATALGEALKDAVSRVGETAVSGAVLISDGVNTTGEDPQEVARFLGIPVHTVAVGGKSAERGTFVDVGIAGVPHNLEFIVDNKATIDARLSNFGLARFAEHERKLTATLEKEGDVLATREIQFPAQNGTREVEINFTPKEVGIHELTLSLPQLPNETVTENNRRTFTVRVTDPKIRTLLVEGVVRAEYRFLRRVLESDPNVELTSVVKLSKERFYQQGVDPGIRLDLGLPVRQEDYDKFDVVILGDISREEFRASQVEMLQDFVHEGGGLLVMGGHNAYGGGGWSGTPLAEMLPVKISSEDGNERGEFSPRLTGAGRVHPVFEGCLDFFGAGSNRALLDGLNRVSGVKGGAEVLAVHPDATSGTAPLPVVVVIRSGGGYVLALTADTTWKWKFQVEARGQDSPYYRFWRQAVRWLHDPDRQPGLDGGKELLNAWPHKIDYKHGETVLLEAQVRGRDKEPTENATVQAEIQYPSAVQKVNPRGEQYAEKKTTVEFQHIPLSLGRYQASFEPPVGGIYRAIVDASDDSGHLGDTQFEFVVGEPVTEFDRVDVDELTLQEVAGETGGRFHTLATASRIPEELEQQRRRVTHHEELNLWNAPGFFMLFLGCVAMEWILRKRYALS